MVEVKNLTKIYSDDTGKNIALDNVSFTLPTKGMVFIVGKSGCGKTTLLNIIGGLDKFTSGDVFINNKAMSSFSVTDLNNYRNNAIGFIFQDFCLIDRLSVLDNIKMSMEFQNNKKEVDYNKLLEQIGLKGFGKRKPKSLSAGQKQRVAIARAIVKEPSIILADEPTGNVDDKTSIQILNLLKEISKERLIVIISHNPEEAYQFADRIIEMSDGKIISDKSLNINYNDSFYIDENKVILPGNGYVSEKQINLINKQVNKSNGDFKINQYEEKFIDNVNENNVENIEIKKVKMSNKVKFKYASFFFRKKILFNIFIILLITFVTSIFSIVEILGFSNTNENMQRILDERGIEEVTLYGYNKTSYLNEVDKHIVEDSSKKYNVSSDYVYNISLPTGQSVSGASINRNMILTSSSIINGYAIASNGVVVTSYDDLIKRFGNIEILAGKINADSSGVIITDYIADCILYYNKDYLSYEDIVNDTLINDKLDVDAIIKTDVYVKYKDQLDDYLNVGKKDTTFLNMLLTKYMYCYSLNENFYDDYLNDYYNYYKPYTIMKASHLSYNNFSTSIASVGVNFYEHIGEEEFYMENTYFNRLMGTNYNDSNYDTFIPTKVMVMFLNSTNETIYQKEVLISGLYTKTFYYDNFRVSKKLYDSFMKENTFAYGIVSLTNQGDFYEYIGELSPDSDLIGKFITSNKEVHLIYATVSLLNTFKEIFIFVGALLISTIFLIIILNANTMIKHNNYEIGLMKAFGARTRDLVVIFAIQMILTNIIVCVLYYFTSKWAINFSDQLLHDGVMAYLSASKGYKMDFHTLIFNKNYFIINILCITFFTFISVFVPILTIRKIQPLKILKARN